MGDTLVATPEGPRRLRDLRPGDAVFAFDLAAGTRVTTTVERLHRARVEEVCAIGPLRGVTASHPMFDASRGRFVPLRDIGADARWRLETGRDAPVGNDVELRRTPGVEVFNLTVAGQHPSYFADGVLVHNKSPLFEPSGPIFCGDAVVSGDEECDDGNGRDGDGCSNRCQLESDGGGGFPIGAGGTGGVGGTNSAGGGDTGAMDGGGTGGEGGA